MEAFHSSFMIYLTLAGYDEKGSYGRYVFSFASICRLVDLILRSRIIYLLSVILVVIFG